MGGAKGLRVGGGEQQRRVHAGCDRHFPTGSGRAQASGSGSGSWLNTTAVRFKCTTALQKLTEVLLWGDNDDDEERCRWGLRVGCG